MDFGRKSKPDAITEEVALGVLAMETGADVGRLLRLALQEASSGKLLTEAESIPKQHLEVGLVVMAVIHAKLMAKGVITADVLKEVFGDETA